MVQGAAEESFNDMMLRLGHDCKMILGSTVGAMGVHTPTNIMVGVRGSLAWILCSEISKSGIQTENYIKSKELLSRIDRE